MRSSILSSQDLIILLLTLWLLLQLPMESHMDWDLFACHSKGRDTTFSLIYHCTLEKDYKAMGYFLFHLLVWLSEENDLIYNSHRMQTSFSEGSDGKESASNAGGLGSILGSGRSLGEGDGYLLQCTCLENSMNRGAWWPTVHRIAKSRTQLSNRH